jgi:hypothetical protein
MQVSARFLPTSIVRVSPSAILTTLPVRVLAGGEAATERRAMRRSENEVARRGTLDCLRVVIALALSTLRRDRSPVMLHDVVQGLSGSLSRCIIPVNEDQKTTR